MRTIIKKRRARRNLPHFEYPGDIVFITISNVRGVILTPAERDLVSDSIKFYDGKLYSLFILVVMPDHTHLLIMSKHISATAGISMSESIGRIKSYTSNKLRYEFRNDQYHWWLDDYFDKTVFDYDGLISVRNYLRSNPVKAELSATHSEYPWYYENLKL